MTQPPPRPNLDALSSEPVCPGCADNLSALVAYARSLEAANQGLRILLGDAARELRRGKNIQFAEATEALLGRDGT